MFLRRFCGRHSSLVRFCSQNQSYPLRKIKELSEADVDQPVRIKGWVRNIRKMKKVYFCDVYDGSSCKNVQVVLTREKRQEMPTMGFAASVMAAGKVSIAPMGNLELVADEFQLIGDCCPTNEGKYPFVRQQTHPPEYLRNYMHLRAGIGEFQAMLRVRHAATNAFHRYFDRNQFTCIHVPVLTSNSCEGAGELFSVTPCNTELLDSMRQLNQPDDQVYFSRKTFLTVSGQLHLEAMCHGMSAVYSFGPTFRAENSKSPIHMSEFYMIEAEEAFIDGVEDITKRIDSLIRTVTTELLDQHATEIDAASKKEFLSVKDRFAWVQKPFPLITYAEAKEILEKHADQLTSPVRDSAGLAKEHELFLVEHIGSPLFVINWPKALKPFYMRQCKHDENLVEAIDFLMPSVGELAGGSVRESNIDVLKRRIPKNLKWYLDLRRFGGCTTGGYGVGFDRYLQVLLGIQNIKDCIPFPRWPHNCAL